MKFFDGTLENFKSILSPLSDKSDFSYDKESDEFTLNCKTDFDNSDMVSILDISSPKVLDVKEHKFIHFLNSLAPVGLNLSNPFAMPLITDD